MDHHYLLFGLIVSEGQFHTVTGVQVYHKPQRAARMTKQVEQTNCA